MTDIITEIKTDVSAVLAKLESITGIGTVVKDVVTDAQTLEQWVVTNGYPLIMQDALTLVTGALTGSTWSGLVASLISTAAAQGAKLEAGAAQVALNLAQSQLIVAGTVAPVTPAPAAA